MFYLLAFLAVMAIVAVVAVTLVATGLGKLGFPLPKADRRIGCIDGLRGYLALSVMIHHFFVWVQATRISGAWSIPNINILNQLGAGGVALFFMTTGLVFYPRILSGLRATPWSTVYITRIFRIIPLVAVSVGIITSIIIARTGATPDWSYLGSAARWVSAWSEVDLLGYPDSGRVNAYVLWSLKYEWVFYILLLPACAAAMDGVRLLKAPTWMLPVALFIGSILVRVTLSLMHLHLDIMQYIPLFAIGMLAYECHGKNIFVRILRGPAAGIFAGVLLVLGMSVAKFPYSFALPLFGIFFIIVACGNPLGGLLTTRGALVLGECSFGLYLLHGILLDVLFVDAKPILDAVKTSFLPALLPVAMVAAVLVSATTYLLVERSLIRFGRWSARNIAGRRVRISNSEAEIAP